MLSAQAWQPETCLPILPPTPFATAEHLARFLSLSGPQFPCLENESVLPHPSHWTMHVKIPGENPERENSQLTRHILPLIDEGSPLGSLSYSLLPQCVGNGPKLLTPLRAQFEGALGGGGR